MNISQLAVYQLPGEIHMMQRRNTVPFYNRRQALKKRERPIGVGISGGHPHLVDTKNKQAQATPSTMTIPNTKVIYQRKRARAVSTAWSRVGHYKSAAPAQATGLSFLANLGDPQKSGTFD